MFVIQGEKGAMTKRQLIEEAVDLYPEYRARAILNVLDRSFGPEITFTLKSIYDVLNQRKNISQNNCQMPVDPK